MNVVCSFVTTALGIITSITAELYNMLIYEKGAMFEAPRSSKLPVSTFPRMLVL